MADPNFYTSEAKLDQNYFETLSGVSEVVGTLSGIITNAVDLNETAKDGIGFISIEKYLPDLQATTLDAVIVLPEMLDSVPKGCFAIVSKQPRVVFGQALKDLYPFIFDTVAEDVSYDAVHPSAEIADNVRLGRGVIIGAHAQIGAGSQIGDYTVIGDHVQLGENCRIGRHNTIRYALIGDDFWCDDHNTLGCAGFAFEFDQGQYVPIAQIGLLRIGKGVHISSGCSIDRGALSDTVIESMVQIESLCKIGHNVHIGAATVIVGHCAIAGSATIGRGVQIAGKVGVKGFTTIGDGARIMACSAVTKDVAPKALMFGVPAIEYKEYGARAQELHKLVKATKQRKQNNRKKV